LGEALSAGRRKGMQAQTLDGRLGLFKNRILPFDTDAARRFIVASRNTAPYEDAGVVTINPWGA